MFKVNDCVVFGTLGVCKIVDRRKEKFGSEEKEYFVIMPVYANSSTIYVPADNCEDKFRQILNIDEVYELIQTVPDTEDLWIDDNQLRRETFTRIIMEGDRKELSRLITLLYQKREEQAKVNAKFHIADENAMKTAEKILYEEFAFILDIKPDEVFPFIIENQKRPPMQVMRRS